MKILRYLFVGFIAMLFDVGFFFIFAKVLNFNYFVVGLIGFMLATLINYFLSIKIVFKSGVRHSKRKEIAYVYFVSIIALGINQMILVYLIKIVGLEKMLSKLSATISVFLWNYFSRKKLIF